MALPLFDERPHGAQPGTPLYFAWWTGFREGADGQSAAASYDPDEKMDGYYQDGHRVGRLFRPLITK